MVEPRLCDVSVLRRCQIHDAQNTVVGNLLVIREEDRRLLFAKVHWRSLSPLAIVLLC